MAIERTICKIPRAQFFVCGTAIILAVVVIIISVFMMHSALPSFQDSLSLTDIVTHLQELQQIADAHESSRGLLFGYNASVDYVEAILTAAGLQVTRQEFPINAYKVTSPSSITALFSNSGTNDTDDVFSASEYREMMYSASAEAQGKIIEIPNFGCVARYPSFISCHVIFSLETK